jgi:hypothetical protein
LLCLFMRTLNVGPAGNGERVRLIAHLGFALFDTNRGRPTANIRPTLRGFLLVSAVALTSCGLPTQGRLQEWVIRQSDPNRVPLPRPPPVQTPAPCRYLEGLRITFWCVELTRIFQLLCRVQGFHCVVLVGYFDCKIVRRGRRSRSCPTSLVESVACQLGVWKIRYETTTLPADTSRAVPTAVHSPISGREHSKRGVSEKL